MIPGVPRNVGDVIAEIKMTATVFSGNFVLVEGPSDSRFMKSRVDNINCQIVICGSQLVAIDATKISNEKIRNP